MNRVDTTVFITPAWKRRDPESTTLGVGRLLALRSLLGWLLLVCALVATPLWAREPEIRQQTLNRQADGVLLSVRLTLEPSAAVEDALLKGVPVYFVWQADVFRERWYWTDKRMSSASRTLRLAYQPLTRRWRVSVSTDNSVGGSGLQYALHQNFETLREALSSIGRTANWRITEAGRLEEGVEYTAQWRFRLDLTLLPRPFQIGVTNQTGWDVEVQRLIGVPARNDAEPLSGGADAR